MADADEDIIRPAAGDTSAATAAASDSDPPSDDETQDFRFLSTLTTNDTSPSQRSAGGAGGGGALPKRGTKDFEPHATSAQTTQLDASRAAMHAALSVGRVHAPRQHVVGVYDAATGLTTVRKIKGNAFRAVGRDVSGGGVVLLPEEALWLLERGSLDVRWGKGVAVGGGVSEENEEEEDNEEGESDEEALLPMSLQGAYAAMIGGEEEGRRGALTLEKYQVYAALKRVGFVVLRAEEWGGQRRTSRRTREVATSSPSAASVASFGLGVYEWLCDVLRGGADRQRRTQRLRFGPLVTPGLYRSYSMPTTLPREREREREHTLWGD